MATGSVREVLPPALDSHSDPPPIFDGTTRLYISYTCPYAQRVWITRNCKDPAKKEYAEELFSYIDSFYKTATSSFKGDGSKAGVAFDYIETALSKFEDGPFFLGQFSLVDIAYAPFIERIHPFLLEVKKYDFTLGRPKLATWIEEMNKNEAYTQTKSDPKDLVQSYKERFMAQL
ncbi:Glutathione S-transferase family protein isoform 4 [Theobroma cacao]|uniref:Glutathione S-transferase family protein isoform 4 n=1 Tax=Theobroma cacao TaxID=3641 RepID=A0A061FUG2_THECC|nr:Glutathione S-transferase family protein isoform 4 [Theobroma cacao]